MLIAAATFTAFIIHAFASRADTISYADAVTALAKECGADIKSSARAPIWEAVVSRACLEENVAKVSPSCTSTLSSVMASITAAARGADGL